MVYCCVPFCKSDDIKGNGISFHQLPANGILREQWIKALCGQAPGKRSTGTWQSTKRSLVCSLHFEPKCFSVSTKYKRLLPNSVPSIFPSPLYFKEELVEEVIDLPKKQIYDIPSPQKRRNVSASKLIGRQLSHDKGGDSHKSISVQMGVKRYRTPSTKRATERTYLAQALKKQNEVIAKLVARNKKLSSRLKMRREKVPLERLYKELLVTKGMKKIKSMFLMQQLKTFGRKVVQYTEDILNICLLWQKQSPKIYEFVRKTGILHLPQNKHLVKYIALSSGEVGITRSIREKWEAKFNALP